MDLATLKAAINNDDTMHEHFKRIVDAVAKGEHTVDFKDLDDQVHNDNQYALTNAQVEILRSKGYTVDYNKYQSREWSVSGW